MDKPHLSDLRLTGNTEPGHVHQPRQADVGPIGPTASSLDAPPRALKGKLIMPEQALELLHDCDVLRLVGLRHEAEQ
jgi:hypothetical protein